MDHARSAWRGLQMARLADKAGAIVSVDGYSFGFTHSQNCRAGVSVQPFRLCEHCRDRPDASRGGFVKRYEADNFYEIPHVERRCETSRATRRHNMTWPRKIVSEYFKRMFAHKNATRVINFFHPKPRIAYRESKMFRSIFICQFHGFLQICCQYRPATTFQRSNDDLRARALLDLSRDLSLNVFDQCL